MLNRLLALRSSAPAVLSLEVQAALPQNSRTQGRFEVLVRHLMHRFLNNELMSSDGETTRAAQLGYLLALPGVLYALFQFPSYHLPVGLRRSYWTQVGDHYFYVVLAIVVMGVVTVYEWDLLFPDLLDVFVLSVLPIEQNRLFTARVVALTIFLGTILLGTNLPGAIFLPLVADLPILRLHLLAHALAVLMGGGFAAGTFLALQGVMLNLLGERSFRRVAPLLQGGSIMLLLTTLFLIPTISHNLQGLLDSGSRLVRWFPPFWYLGIYECILTGRAAPGVFQQLAATGCWATCITLLLVLATYPLAYRRRVRQLIEGSGGMDLRSWMTRPMQWLLHGTFLRTSARLAVFHFVRQTLLRTQKHRVLLAMYGGLGVAFALSGMLVFRASRSGVHVGLLAEGVRSAVPIVAFWTTMGLRTALAAPVDRRGSWVFRVILGRASLEHLNGAKVWMALWSILLTTGTMFLLLPFSPTELRTPSAVAGQLVIAIGLSVLLTDCLLLRTVTLPFTGVRKASITEMPWAVVRYFVAFPVLVLASVELEVWMQMRAEHFVRVVILMLAFHSWWRWRYAVRVREMRLGSDFEDEDPMFQGLGLHD